VTALRVLPRAWTMLRRERSLWPWALVPFALNLFAFGLAAAAFVAHLDAIAGPLERMLAVATPEHWYGYLWAGPLWLLPRRCGWCWWWRSGSRSTLRSAIGR
jgi:hypothetical protein